MSKRGRERAKEVILSILQEYTTPLSSKEILMGITSRKLKGYGRTEWGTRRIGGFLRQLREEGKVEHVGDYWKWRWRIMGCDTNGRR